MCFYTGDDEDEVQVISIQRTEGLKSMQLFFINNRGALFQLSTCHPKFLFEYQFAFGKKICLKMYFYWNYNIMLWLFMHF